ncbi:hypothetical protein PMAYCL1PPCAC_19982, partial [Pristionchus mayeri]
IRARFWEEGSGHTHLQNQILRVLQQIQRIRGFRELHRVRHLPRVQEDQAAKRSQIQGCRPVPAVQQVREVRQGQVLQPQQWSDLRDQEPRQYQALRGCRRGLVVREDQPVQVLHRKRLLRVLQVLRGCRQVLGHQRVQLVLEGSRSRSRHQCVLRPSARELQGLRQILGLHHFRERRQYPRDQEDQPGPCRTSSTILVLHRRKLLHQQQLLLPRRSKKNNLVRGIFASLRLVGSVAQLRFAVAVFHQ